MKEKIIKLAVMNPESAAKEIGDFIVRNIASAHLTGGVIGLSGGVDSTTTAALAKKAFDNYNKEYGNRLELLGYMLPSKTNEHADERDAVKVAKRLGIRYEILNIEPVVQSFYATNPEAFVNNYDKGNLMSRIRANILSTKAATEKKLVIGTGNRDEDFGVGYYTLFGDGAVHMSPIGELPKRLVREMARYLGFADLADRIPTAGLEPGQTDFKDLGYEYETVELVSEGFRQGFSADELVASLQVREYTAKDIAKYEQLFGRKKFCKVEEIVEDIMLRNMTARAKAEIIHPPIAPVTLEYR